MRKLPEKPISLRPQGTRIALPKLTLIIDSMEQKAYTFKPFWKWFAAMERRKLPNGDYSIAGLEERVVVPERPLCGRVNAWVNLILRRISRSYFLSNGIQQVSCNRDVQDRTA
jgi:hypothetical protein